MSKARSRETVFLVLRPAGRLGNQLTTFAYLMAHCLDQGGRVLNPAFAEYGPLFEGTARDALCRFPAVPDARATSGTRRALSVILRGLERLDRVAPNWIGRVRKGQLQDEPNAAILRRHRYVLPTTWWVSDFAALTRHQTAVRAFFRPVATIRETVDTNVQVLRRRGDLVIGVHIRRSDYETVVPMYFYDYDVYLGYMRAAVEMFADRKVIFFLSSDERIPTEIFSEFETVHFAQGAVEDMYTLAECDYIIGTKSSFNSWASFYGQTPTYWILGQDRPLVRDEFIAFAPGFIPQHAACSLTGAKHPYFTRRGD